MPGSKHYCHAAGCKVVVVPERLMCLRHWRMVPHSLRCLIWATYRFGQCDDKRPSREWFHAATAAIQSVALQEKNRRKR